MTDTWLVQYQLDRSGAGIFDLSRFYNLLCHPDVDYETGSGSRANNYGELYVDSVIGYSRGESDECLSSQ